MPWHDARNLSSAFFIYLDKNAEFIYTLTCLEISGLAEMPITGWTSGRLLVFLFSFKSNCTKNFNLQHRSKPLLRANKKHTTQTTRVCFLWSEWRDLLRNPTGAGVLCAFFCAANAVAITPGTKNSAPCCFLNVPFKSRTFLQKKWLARWMCKSFSVGAVDGTWTHTVSHTPLKRTRLPVPPRPQARCNIA